MKTKAQILQKIGELSLKRARAEQAYIDLHGWFTKAYPRYWERDKGTPGRKEWMKKREPILEAIRESKRQLRGYVALFELRLFK